MKVFVIDSDHPLPPTTGENEHALIAKSGDAVILREGASISATGHASQGINAGLRMTMLIDGSVHSSQESAISMQGSILVGRTGVVDGDLAGLFMGEDTENGTANIIQNEGRIRGVSAGIYLDGQRTTIINSGEIWGADGVLAFSTEDPSQSLMLSNSGSIIGAGGSAIIGVAHGPNIIKNTGSIQGQVTLGFGNDVYDGRGGTVTGDIRLWQGNDVANGGNGSETFEIGGGTKVIDGGDGVDTLRCTFAATVDLGITEMQRLSAGTNATLSHIENIEGGRLDDRFTGSDAANVLLGGLGQDTLAGQGGDDILSGGGGNDSIVGGTGTDTALYSGRFEDYTFGHDPDGNIVITDSRTGGDGADVLREVETAIFSDRIVTLPKTGRPPEGSGTPSGSSSSPATSDSNPASSQGTPAATEPMRLIGGARADNLVGGEGNDWLNGGLGNDALKGAGGSDTFQFSTRLGARNVDSLKDFSHGEDRIALSQSIFKALHKGGLSKAAFFTGDHALDSSDRVGVNLKTGVVSYDADGSGAGDAVAFARVKPGLHLTAGDFLVV